LNRDDHASNELNRPQLIGQQSHLWASHYVLFGIIRTAEAVAALMDRWAFTDGRKLLPLVTCLF
jgi:hypothetical protein